MFLFSKHCKAKAVDRHVKWQQEKSKKTISHNKFYFNSPVNPKSSLYSRDNLCAVHISGFSWCFDMACTASLKVILP